MSNSNIASLRFEFTTRNTRRVVIVSFVSVIYISCTLKAFRWLKCKNLGRACSVEHVLLSFVSVPTLFLINVNESQGNPRNLSMYSKGICDKTYLASSLYNIILCGLNCKNAIVREL
jgi:hypothetical protein